MAESGDPNQPELVPPVEPQTAIPILEQGLVREIPSDVWRKLSPDQIYQLAEKIFESARRSQEQRFEFEREAAKSEDKRNSMNLIFGAIIVVVGYGVSAYLALNGQKEWRLRSRRL